MRTLVIGADGFIGRTLCRVLGSNSEVIMGARGSRNGTRTTHYVDLLQPSSITAVLAKTQPDVVVNCAGIFSSAGTATNTAMTGNLLQAILKSELDVTSIVVCGSAATYGRVPPENLPVRESYELKADSVYGLDKVREEALGRLYRYSYGLPVVSARIFNPIGAGMAKRQLLPNICRQLWQWKAGRRERLEVSRLDSTRDYLPVTDVARALGMLAHGQPREFAYNIGSGHETSNGELLHRVFTLANLSELPPVDQTSSTPELPLASQADIKTISSEFGWRPKVALDDSILEVLDESVR